MFPIYQVIFFIFTALLIISAVVVVISGNPVRAVFFLVLSFFASSVLWIMMQAEFLALVLIFMYVGAVMTLFIFVVMMLNIGLPKLRFVKFLPIILVALILLTMIIVSLYFSVARVSLPFVSSNFNDVRIIGNLLYSKYLYPLEISAVILLVAVIAAITLTFNSRKTDAKAQKIIDQLRVKKSNRLRLVKMKVEK